MTRSLSAQPSPCLSLSFPKPDSPHLLILAPRPIICPPSHLPTCLLSYYHPAIHLLPAHRGPLCIHPPVSSHLPPTRALQVPTWPTSGPWACRAPRRRCPSCPCSAARWAAAGWHPGSVARRASAGGGGSARRGGCRRPRPHRPRPRRSALYLVGTGLESGRQAWPPGTLGPGQGQGHGCPTGSPDGRVLHRAGGREQGLLALALPVPVPLPLPLGRGGGGGFRQVSGASWKPKGLQLSPRVQDGPGFVFWGGTEGARHLPEDMQPLPQTPAS